MDITFLNAGTRLEIKYKRNLRKFCIQLFIIYEQIFKKYIISFFSFILLK